MKLTLPDKKQWLFIVGLMGLISYYAGSVAVYFLNGYNIKFLFNKYDSGVLGTILTQSEFTSKLWLSGVTA
ncbi:conjugal transfer protein TraG, partial [Klebsiella pneumoniae]